MRRCLFRLAALGNNPTGQPFDGPPTSGAVTDSPLGAKFNRSAFSKLDPPPPRGIQGPAAVLPGQYVSTSDVLWTFPRFFVGTHVSDALPELIDVKKQFYESAFAAGGMAGSSSASQQPPIHSSPANGPIGARLRDGLERARDIFFTIAAPGVDSSSSSSSSSTKEQVANDEFVNSVGKAPLPVLRQLISVTAAQCAVANPLTRRRSDVELLQQVSNALRWHGGAAIAAGVDTSADANFGSFPEEGTSLVDFDAGCMIIASYFRLHHRLRTRHGAIETVEGKAAAPVAAGGEVPSSIDNSTPDKAKIATVSSRRLLRLPSGAHIGEQYVALPDPAHVRATIMRLRTVALTLANNAQRMDAARATSSSGGNTNNAGDPVILLSSIRSAYAKLCALQALAVLHDSGDCGVAFDLCEYAMKLSGYDAADRGLIAVIAAEVKFRHAGDYWGYDATDEGVSFQYEFANERFTEHFEHAKSEQVLTTTGLEGLRDAYTCCLASRAVAYLSQLRGDGTPMNKDQLLPKRVFYATSPVLSMPLPPQLEGRRPVETTTKLPLPSKRCLSLAAAVAERALKANRVLFAADRNNIKSARLLTTVALVYAELRDYVYASGLFNAALKVIEYHYGPTSEEVLEHLQLMEHFQRCIGSPKEAEATRSRLAQLREALSL